MPYDVETDESIDEMMEAMDESNDESSDEAARSWRPRGKVASGKNLYSPRPQTQYVTQQQLQTALAKVGAQVRSNSVVITQIGSKMAGLAATVKKEANDRKKDINALRSSLSQTQQMSAILPLLTQPTSVTLTQNAGNLTSGTKVLTDSGSSLSLLMPMLLFSSLGDGSNTSGSASSSPMGGLFGGGGSDGGMSMMMMALIFSGNLGK